MLNKVLNAASISDLLRRQVRRKKSGNALFARLERETQLASHCDGDKLQSCQIDFFQSEEQERDATHVSAFIPVITLATVAVAVARIGYPGLELGPDLCCCNFHSS
jgi:hypothetical protein